MKIYIVERDNPQTRPEPEVFKDWIVAKAVITKEFEEMKRDLDITLEDIQCCNGNYCVTEESDIYGNYSASIVDAWSFERWEWRVTEHDIEFHAANGEWTRYLNCTVCGWSDDQFGLELIRQCNFCPNCGAYMRGESE